MAERVAESAISGVGQVADATRQAREVQLTVQVVEAEVALPGCYQRPKLLQHPCILLDASSVQTW